MEPVNMQRQPVNIDRELRPAVGALLLVALVLIGMIAEAFILPAVGL